jgi:catecholate siderophore receptor
MGAVHQARMYAAIDNAVTLPAFTRLDGALFYSFGAHLLAQINIENVANARFVVSANGNNNLQPGAPRAVRVSVTVR